MCLWCHLVDENLLARYLQRILLVLWTRLVFQSASCWGCLLKSTNVILMQLLLFSWCVKSEGRASCCTGTLSRLTGTEPLWCYCCTVCFSTTPNICYEKVRWINEMWDRMSRTDQVNSPTWPVLILFDGQELTLKNQPSPVQWQEIFPSIRFIEMIETVTATLCHSSAKKDRF